MGLFVLGLTLATAVAQAAEPFADIHTHWKWSQEEVTTADEVLSILARNDVSLAVVIGTPAEMALDLAARAPEVVVPIWSPYRRPGDWSSWAFDKTVVARAREALAGGRYRGIGELHLIGGFAPRAESPVLDGLLRLAAEFDVPVLLHTEINRPAYLTELCAAHPRTRILWAHAGAVLSPARVDEVMRACPNLYAELSARDPWRFVGNPIADESGDLRPDWLELVLRYPQRFLVGSDPVWPVERLDGWDEPDTGWQHYGRFIGFHRAWLSRLPPEVAGAIRQGNARRLFRGPDPGRRPVH